jgi:phage protein D
VVQGSDLHFRRRAFDGEPALTLYREVELLEFHARLSTLGQVPALEVRGWDPAQKTEIVARADGGPRTMGGGTLGPEATKQAFSPPDAARVDAPVQSQDEADAMARQGFAGMALGYVQAEGTCIGEPRLRAGMVVAIEGIGKRFSGRWYVTAVEHAYTPKKGFRTSFAARRNAS